MSAGREDASEDTNPEIAGQPRDDSGRFAPANPEPVAPQAGEGGQIDPGQQEPQAPEGYVPQQALHAARETAREMKERLAAAEERERSYQQMLARYSQPQPQAPQKPAETPEFWSDPEGYLKAQLEPFAQQQASMREHVSQMMAVEKFGAETVQTAYQSLDQAMSTNPALRAQLMARIEASPHPYAEVVKIHQERSALTRYGEDPEAYIKAEIERRMAEMTGGGAPAQPSSQTPQAMPSSFAAGRNAGPRATPQWSGPKPLSEIMGGR